MVSLWHVMAFPLFLVLLWFHYGSLWLLMASHWMQMGLIWAVYGGTYILSMVSQDCFRFAAIWPRSRRWMAHDGKGPQESSQPQSQPHGLCPADGAQSQVESSCLTAILRLLQPRHIWTLKCEVWCVRSVTPHNPVGNSQCNYMITYILWILLYPKYLM